MFTKLFEAITFVLKMFGENQFLVFDDVQC